MSLTDNTTELEEVLNLANSIEVPTIKSISVNGVAQTPDANRNVNLTIPESSGASLYRHDITVYVDNYGDYDFCYLYFTIIDTTATPYNSMEQLYALPNSTVIKSATGVVNYYNYDTDTLTNYPILYYKMADGGQFGFMITVTYYHTDNKKLFNTNIDNTYSGLYTITDTITQIL